MHRTIAQFNLLIFVLLLFSCKDSEEVRPTSSTPSFSPIIHSKSVALRSTDPLSWTDANLFFLDAMTQNKIIGLGEGTHGTAQFFDAKHRMFRYLVENHNMRILGIEADFGESVKINEAIQNGNCDELEDLMQEHMLYWTWQTEEIKAMLEWMCTYNQDKSEEEKIQYFGFDSFSNKQNPGVLLSYLNDSRIDFFEEDFSVLERISAWDAENYEGYTETEVNDCFDELDALILAFETNEGELTDATSAAEFQSNFQLLKIVRQVVEVRTTLDYSLRDLYMAENAIWLSNYFTDEKIVLWAHNTHVAKDESYVGGGSMGYHISEALPGAYESLIFLFSRGSFTAVTQVGSQSLALETHHIHSSPLQNSVNLMCHETEESVFYLNTGELKRFDGWINRSLIFFDIASGFGERLENYYKDFHTHRYDHLMYFDEVTESKLLSQ